MDKALGCPLIRYPGPFFRWTKEGLKQMDQRTRKLTAMNKVLHSRDDVSRKGGGRELTGIEDNVDASTRRLHQKEQRKTNYSN